jgi:uncharacterized protein YqgC (DUF456 family)
MDHVPALGMLFGPVIEVLWAEILKETVESRRQKKIMLKSTGFVMILTGSCRSANFHKINMFTIIIETIETQISTRLLFNLTFDEKSKITRGNLWRNNLSQLSAIIYCF